MGDESSARVQGVGTICLWHISRLQALLQRASCMQTEADLVADKALCSQVFVLLAAQNTAACHLLHILAC